MFCLPCLPRPWRSLHQTISQLLLSLTLICLAQTAAAWDDHAMLSYRALEQLPQLGAHVSALAEPLDAFLKAQEQGIEKLLSDQEDWAEDSLRYYAKRPAELAFRANAAHSDAQRRTALLAALRIAPDTRFALYVQPDPWAEPPARSTLLQASAVKSGAAANDSGQVFVGLAPGERVAALSIVASASDEPDYGMDLGLWSDSATPAGVSYGFGSLPFGNPRLLFSTQAPFHMGFFHEASALYWAAPFIRRTYPLWRIHQFVGLSRLAFGTGHSYWGWRFAGLAMHYVQDLTQPYHARLAPGSTTAELIKTNALAMLGFGERKHDTIVLLSNRHLALERYESTLVRSAARDRRPTALEAALHDFNGDAKYPAWSENYVRDVVSLEAYQAADALNQTVVSALPAEWVSDPKFDFGLHAPQIDMRKAMEETRVLARLQLDSELADLLRHFGSHSRALVRGVLATRSAK